MRLICLEIYVHSELFILNMREIFLYLPERKIQRNKPINIVMCSKCSKSFKCAKLTGAHTRQCDETLIQKIAFKDVISTKSHREFFRIIAIARAGRYCTPLTLTEPREGTLGQCLRPGAAQEELRRGREAASSREIQREMP